MYLHVNSCDHLPTNIYASPLSKEGNTKYCFAHVSQLVCLSVSMSVSLNLVQLITQERFAPEVLNLVGR